MPSEDCAGSSVSVHCHCAAVANPGLVAPAVENVNSSTFNFTTTQGSTNFTTLTNVTPFEEENDYGGMSSVWQTFRSQGIPEAACKLIMDSWRLGTRKQYSTYLRRWINFCGQQQIDYLQPPLELALTFLTNLFTEGLSYSALNTARSALSSLISFEDGTKFGSHPLVIRLLKGMYHNRPPKPRYSTIWNVDTVLSYLKGLAPVSNLSLKELSLKLTMLLLLVTGQRGQTIHLLNLDNMTILDNQCIFTISGLLKQSRQGKSNPLIVLKAFKQDVRICVFATLLEYIARTNDLRHSERFLLISYIKPHKRISRDTLTRWVSVTMEKAGIDISRFKPHSTRAASTSKAKQNSVNLEGILSTAGWSSARTFALFYDKPILEQSHFSDGVLNGNKD